MNHAWCDLAKGHMLLAYAGTGLFLSDGSTNVLPVAPHVGTSLTSEQLAANRAAVHHAWQLSHGHIRHSLEGGFYQGWDLHPAQIPVRFATCYAFFLDGFAAAADRLRNFVDKAAQATLVGEMFDDAATGQGLLNYFLRALNPGSRPTKSSSVRLPGSWRRDGRASARGDRGAGRGSDYSRPRCPITHAAIQKASTIGMIAHIATITISTIPAATNQVSPRLPGAPGTA
jgi:hypothetical protein